jgi:DNA-binding MarR family transcriptional regulator
MSTRRTSPKARLAAEAWRLLFDFFLLTRAQRDRVLAQHGLSPNDVRALGMIAEGGGRTMSALAEAWGCDASNATWMVDRLEQRGFAERRPQPGDRRVKLVVLTAAGVKAKADLLKDIYEPPPELLDLSAEALTALRDALSKLPRAQAEADAEGRPAGGVLPSDRK